MPRQERTEDLLRQLAPQVLGVLMRRRASLDDAEDAVQEALIAAARHWPADGLPDNPRAWLVRTAERKLADQARSDQARRRREVAAIGGPRPAPVSGTDDTLVLLFMCCHPALSPASAIALTLRAVGGLTTAEIARSFLVPEATMAQRISRAKRSIRASGEPFRLPAPDQFATRRRSVLHVLYLIFSEGYASSTGPRLHRQDLAAEAIRLTRMTATLLPQDPDVMALLALMLLTEARRPARTGPSGELIPLSEQDRRAWDSVLIEEGHALATRAWTLAPGGEYQIQAAIAALHDEAPTAADTDWPQILALYGALEQLTGNPVVRLNRAVAMAMVHGPAAGLVLLDPLDQALAGSHRVGAVRGHLHEMLGETEEAICCYRSAARATASVPEQNYLTMKAARLASDAAGQPRICDPGSMQTVYEAAGGADGTLKLARAWHERVMADEVVSHAFSGGYEPDHAERLAAYWSEALGGPAGYTGTYGDETSVVRIHSGNGEHTDMDRRAIACFDQALADTGLDADDRLRQVLHDYFAWATTMTMARYHESEDDVPAGLRVPHWSWDGLAG